MYWDEEEDERAYTWLRNRCSQHEGDNPNNEPPFDERPAMIQDGLCTMGVWFYGWYYCYTGARVTDMGYEACNEQGAACLSHPDKMRNGLRCEGDGAAMELVEKMADEEGSTIEIDYVLIFVEGVKGNDGSPLFAGAVVTERIMAQGRGKTI